MSVSFFPSVPYPDKIGVNMTYSSFGEVRQIVAGLIDKEFADLIKEAYSERLPSDFYTRYDKCCERLKETVGEGFFELFNQSDCEGEMNKDACKDFLAAMKDKDLNEMMKGSQTRRNLGLLNLGRNPIRALMTSWRN